MYKHSHYINRLCMICQLRVADTGVNLKKLNYDMVYIAKIYICVSVCENSFYLRTKFSFTL